MSIVPFFYQHFHDLSGKLAAAGRMHVYIAGSPIAKPIWSDVSMSIPRDNPMLLDGNGVAPQWFVGEGLVDIKVYTSTGSLIFTALNVSGTAASGQTPWPAASTGYLYFDEVSGVYSWRDAPGDHKVMVNANDTPAYLDQKLLGNGDLQWQEVEIEPGVWGMRAVINTAGLPGIETLTLLPPSHMEFRQLSPDPKNPRFLLEWTGSANDLVKTDGNSIAKNSLEPALGNPTDDGMVLASQHLGARYWRKLLESIGLSLGPAMDAIADVTNSPVTEDGNIGLELADQPSGKAFMSPVSGTGKPSMRTITIGDVHALADKLPILITRFMETSEAPPSSPSIGDVYALSFGMTGVFAGHDNDIATWDGIAWSFVAPIYKQLAYNISAYSNASTQGGFYYWGGSFPFWVNLQYKDLQSYAIRAKNSLTIGDFSAFEYAHPNSAAATQSILVFDRANIQTTGIAFKTAGSNKYVSISGSDVNEREVNLRGFSTGAPLDEGIWTSLRLLDIKAVNGVFTGAAPVERINALGAGFLTALSVSGQVTQWSSELVTSGRYVKTNDTTIGPSATAKASMLNGGVLAGGFSAVTDQASRWNALGAASETVLKGNVSSAANQALVFELYRNGAVSATLTLPARSYGAATPWRLVIDHVVRVAGASGTVRVKMRAYVTADNVNSTASCYDMSATLTGVDLTASHTWDVVCTIPNNSSNSITCDYAKKIG